MPETDDIYTRLGIQPVINATGHVTILGGSVLSPAVQAAMAAANRSFAAMQEVHNRTGSLIAEMLGVENAVVTSGCYAALVQGAAGILAGTDPERIARLPDTTGIPTEFLIQGIGNSNPQPPAIDKRWARTRQAPLCANLHPAIA